VPGGWGNVKNELRKLRGGGKMESLGGFMGKERGFGRGRKVTASGGKKI